MIIKQAHRMIRDAGVRDALVLWSAAARGKYNT